jgi:hypothetical protein
MSLVGAQKALGKKYYEWYCGAVFPSTDWDNYVPEEGAAPLKTEVQTVVNSTLCSVSRDTWEESYQRAHPWEEVKAASRDRCTKVICDCTRKAVELLNAWKSGAMEEDAREN